MTSKSLFHRLDAAVVGLIALLGVSVAMAFSLTASGQANAFTLTQTAPKVYNSPLASRDGCYSNLNAVGKLSGLLGSGQWGLVNAIVNVPIYDWDQNGDDLQTILYRAQNLISPKGGLRQDALGRGSAIGYMKNFDFTETPVPNPYWVFRYVTDQLPYDLRQLSTGFHAGPKNGDYIANPFIYQQTAAIDNTGIPIPALLNGNQVPAGGNTGQYGDANDGIGIANGQTGNNAGTIGNINNNKDDILSDYNAGNLQDPDFIGQMVSGVFGFASHTFGVRGSNPADNCYESIAQGGYSAPSYAFSVINPAVPVTIPGWMYSPITFLDGKGFSSSGVTFYLGGTVNAKFILDCFGRGRQPIVTPSGNDLLWFLLGGELQQLGQGLFGSTAVNAAVVAGVIAANSPIICIPFLGCAPIPNIPAIYNQLKGLPAVTSAWENYYTGFVFGFKILPNGNFQLPDYLNNRVINYNKVKLFDINIAGLLAAGENQNFHDRSQNGAQFNPDVYVTLKEPYHLGSDVTMTDEYHRMQDGSDVNVKIDTLKNGFKATPKYTPYDNSDTDSGHAGGPTYNDNAGASGRSFSQAHVYRVEMKPGVVPNAIDLDKYSVSKADNPVDYDKYLSYKNDPSTSDPCSFMHARLDQGDSNAQASKVPDDKGNVNNANKDRATFSEADAYKCQDVSGPIDLRMNTGQHVKELMNFTEHIPAETPPGTKICFAVYYNSYTNDSKYKGSPWYKAPGQPGNYNADYSAPDNSSMLTRATCIVAGYKPSFQVRSGDLIVGQDVFTQTNTKEYLQSPKGPDGKYAKKRTYGSWAEYGALAGGTIQSLGSGASYRLGMPPTLFERGFLSIANDRDSSNSPDYGKYNTPASIDDGFEKVASQFTAAAGDAIDKTSENTIDVNTLASGVYKLKSGPVDVVSSGATNGQIGQKKSIILLAQKDTTLNVKSNITLPLQYGSVGDISQIVIAPADANHGYKLNVASNVTQLDAWLINPDGAINTCWIPNLKADGTDSYRLTPRAKSECDNTLYINGPVSASVLYLRRSGGKDQSSDIKPQPDQSIPGENFNLRPDAYIWAANYVNNSNTKYITTNVMDLPPRY